jgi:hypothetical protein
MRGCAFGMLGYLVLYTPAFVMSLITCCYFQKGTVTTLGASLAFLPGFLGWVLMPACAGMCMLKGLAGLASWALFPVFWATSAYFGMNIMSLAENMPETKGKKACKFPLRAHALVVLILYSIALAIGFHYKSVGCDTGFIIHMALFTPGLVMSIAFACSNKEGFLRCMGVCCGFGPGFLGWVLFPMTAVTCGPDLEFAQLGWVVFPIYWIFSFASGGRFLASEF